MLLESDINIPKSSSSSSSKKGLNGGRGRGGGKKGGAAAAAKGAKNAANAAQGGTVVKGAANSAKDIAKNVANGILGRLAGGGQDLHAYLSASAMGSPLGIVSRDENFDFNALMGAPFKFSESDDPPLPGSREFGRSYAKQFLSWGQIVTFSPGTAIFLPGVTNEVRQKFSSSQANTSENGASETSVEDLQSAIFDKSGGKLYAFAPARQTYFAYVNLVWKYLCMLAGISQQDSKIANYISNGAANNLASIDWGKTLDVGNSLYRVLLEQTGATGARKAEGLVENFKAFFGNNEFLMSLDGTQAYVPFYHDGPITSNDSFDNQTGESSIGQKINEFGGAELMRELAFLSGKSYEAISEQEDEANKNQTSDAKTILKGKLWGIKTIIPDIWKDASSNSREHTFTFKLACAEGSMECYSVQVLRPLSMLLSLALPIHSVGNFGFSAPLLCRVYARGISNVDVGIISSLSIQKDPKSVTAMGIMTDMTVTVTVKDLTPIVALPHSRNGFKAHMATGFISVLGGLAGVNATLYPWEGLELPQFLGGLRNFFSPAQNIAGAGRFISDKIGALKVWLRN